MNFRTFIEYLGYLGLDSLPSKYAQFTATVNGILSAFGGVFGVRASRVTAVDHNISTPDSAALTTSLSDSDRLTWRAVLGLQVDSPVAAPVFAAVRANTGSPLSVGGGQTFGSSDAAYGFGALFYGNATTSPGVHLFSSGAGLTASALMTYSSLAATSLVSWAGERTPTAQNSELNRYCWAAVDRLADARTGATQTGCSFTSTTTAITVTKASAFPSAPAAGAASWNVGDLVTLLGPTELSSFVGGGTAPFVVVSKPDDSTLVLGGSSFGGSYPVFSTAVPNLQVTKLRGVGFYVSNQDQLPVLRPRHRLLNDADFYNGEASSIGALLNADGVNLDFGSGAGLYVYDGQAKSGSTLNGWRRLGDGALAVTATAGADLVATRTANGITTSLVKGLSQVMLSAASAVTVGTATTTPILPDGYDGQRVKLINVGANNITLTDQGTMAASNLRLTATTVVLTPRSSIELTFSSAVGDWLQTGELVQPL